MKWNWIMLPNDAKFPLHQLLNYIAKFVKYVLTIWVTWQCLIRGRNCLLFARIWVHPRCLVGSVLFIVLVLCVVLLFVFVLCPVCPMLPVSLDCPVCPMLPVSLDCPFLINPSVFSNVYLQVTSLSWL